MKLGMYIMAPEPISTDYLINYSQHSMGLYLYHLTVAKQRLGKNVTSATNTHAVIAELLDLSFSIWSLSYQRKVGRYFFPEYLIYWKYSLKVVWRILFQ
jgi:hypothetical protein